MINYEQILYNLKIASFEDISISSEYTPKQKKVLYRVFINFLKNINKYPNAFSRLIDLFKKEKEIKSSTDPFHKDTYDLIKYNSDYIKKCIENYLQTESALGFVGVDTSFKKEDLKDENIDKVREDSQNKKKQELQEMREKGKKRKLTVPQDELNTFPSPSSKEMDNINKSINDKNVSKSINKSKFVDQSIIDKAMNPFEEYGGEDVEYYESEEEPVDVRLKKNPRFSSEDSLIKVAIELLQEDYSLFGTTVLPKFFKTWLEANSAKILEKSGLSKKIEPGVNFKKEETTDATGTIIRVGDNIKLIPTFSGEEDNNSTFIITAITNALDTIEQDPTKRLDYVSYTDKNSNMTKVEPHYMVIKVETKQKRPFEASEEDLLIHQAIYDVFYKMAIDFGIVQKNLENLNPGEESEATGPDNAKLQVSKDTDGNISVKDEQTTEPPITVSKETAPQLDETLRQKNIQLVQNQV